jgi:hypothetical protein
MKSVFKILAVLGLSMATGYAGTDVSKHVTELTPAFSPFEKGGHEIELTSGWFHSDVVASGRRRIEFVENDLSYGWMLTSPHGSGLFRGNWEFLLSAFGSGITDGPGGFMSGGRLKLRYNFVQEHCRVIPFFELGAGGLGNDIYLDHHQSIIGSAFEFDLEASLGARIMISDRWAISLLGSFEHVSNAGTASRNIGLNSAGGRAGICFFY